ncbi:uncharacterized protein LOC117077805 [Trachypithecus francoisi]|uniref:uncharacterized protein LOC117077805 n=1 Tax=Trachypithecus francoisi TaxID=54180 RepID=UPI00141B6CDB|nr:uncharacterized protein LOC117077805 [Trachypithecus francoisi]
MGASPENRRRRSHESRLPLPGLENVDSQRNQTNVHPAVTSAGGDWGLGTADCRGTPYRLVSVLPGAGAKRPLAGAVGSHQSPGSRRASGLLRRSWLDARRRLRSSGLPAACPASPRHGAPRPRIGEPSSSVQVGTAGSGLLTITLPSTPVRPGRARRHTNTNGFQARSPPPGPPLFLPPLRSGASEARGGCVLRQGRVRVGETALPSFPPRLRLCSFPQGWKNKNLGKTHTQLRSGLDRHVSTGFLGCTHAGRSLPPYSTPGRGSRAACLGFHPL